MLRLDDHWIWDSWVADDGERYHLFYLQAPRALGEPGLRHVNATIGHAVSVDLVDWEVMPEALAPTPGGWDDLAIWTGSVVRRDDGTWLMFYTAINTRGLERRDQRIGVAESDDLVAWRKLGAGPLLEVDRRWYKSLEEDPSASDTWRDPLVFRDPDGTGWHMFVTARALGYARLDDAVIAHATSADLRTWEVGPPVCEGGHGFGEIEVVQVRVVDGQHLLVFTCHPEQMTEERRARSGDYCTWSVTGDSALGPWDIAKAQPFTAEPALFAAPLVQGRDGGWVLVGFRNLDDESALEILDPVPVQLVDGVLVAKASYDPARNPPATHVGEVG